VEGYGEKQTEGQPVFHVASDSQENPAPFVKYQVPSRVIKPRRIDMLRRKT
jgi:hypothetical protein